MTSYLSSTLNTIFGGSIPPAPIGLPAGCIVVVGSDNKLSNVLKSFTIFNTSTLQANNVKLPIQNIYIGPQTQIKIKDNTLPVSNVITISNGNEFNSKQPALLLTQILLQNNDKHPTTTILWNQIKNNIREITVNTHNITSGITIEPFTPWIFKKNTKKLFTIPNLLAILLIIILLAYLWHLHLNKIISPYNDYLDSEYICTIQTV